MTTAIRPSRLTPYPPPFTEDPRPWIPQPPSGPKSAAVPPLPTRFPGAALIAEQVDAAYEMREIQLAQQVSFERHTFELAAGGVL